MARSGEEVEGHTLGIPAIRRVLLYMEYDTLKREKKVMPLNTCF